MSSQVINLLHPLQDIYRWWRLEHARVRALHEAGRMGIQDLADLDGATHRAGPTGR